MFADMLTTPYLCLDYGVMVAQQILVLFVQVRILVVQPHFKIHSPSKEDAS